MSFILDALRKSESERQRGSVPGIAQVPLAVAKPTLPGWAIGVMLSLAASAVLMAGAWWLAIGAGDERPAVTAPLPATAAYSAAPASAATPLPPAPRPSESLRSAAALPQRDASPAGSGEPDARSVEPMATPLWANVPSAAELAARGVELPSLRLELHVYAAAPADRYVFINGKLYREGQTLSEGPELMRIEPRGVTLRHRGQEFSLSQ